MTVSEQLSGAPVPPKAYPGAVPGLEPIRRALRSPAGMSLAVGALVFFATELIRQVGGLEALELQAYDAYIRYRPAAVDAPPRVAVVEVSEPDIKALGTWPMPDDVLARALDTLAGYQPRAIGVDIFRDTPVPPGRAYLDEVLTQHSNVVVVYRFNRNDEIGEVLRAFDDLVLRWLLIK